jgi:hypothetical protein
VIKEDKFSRNGYGYEIINFYVHENDIEKVKEIKQEIIQHSLKDTITEPKWGLLILIVIFFILIATKFL